jgi:hypothetical protein
MWLIDSSFDESRNEQVLTITTSADAVSGTTSMPACCRWPTMISLSTRFLAQPREMRLTLIIGGLSGAESEKKPRRAAAAGRETADFKLLQPWRPWSAWRAVYDA